MYLELHFSWSEIQIDIQREGHKWVGSCPRRRINFKMGGRKCRRFGKGLLLEMLRNHSATNYWMGPANINCCERYITQLSFRSLPTMSVSGLFQRCSNGKFKSVPKIAPKLCLIYCKTIPNSNRPGCRIQRTSSSLHCTGKNYVLLGVYLGELTRPGGIQIYAIEVDTLVHHDPKTSTLEYYNIGWVHSNILWLVQLEHIFGSLHTNLTLINYLMDMIPHASIGRRLKVLLILSDCNPPPYRNLNNAVEKLGMVLSSPDIHWLEVSLWP